MSLDSLDVALIKRLIHGRAQNEPATFSRDETSRLLAMIEGRVLKATSIIPWQASLGATQNLSEDEFLDTAGIAYFLR